MSSVPAEIAGIGSTQQRLRVSPGFDPLKAAVGPEEYFVLSRIDGSQALREILLNSGLPVDRCITIITRLRAIGALLLPGEASAPSASAPGKSSPIPTIPSGPAIARAPTKPGASAPATKRATSNIPVLRHAAPAADPAPPTTGEVAVVTMIAQHDLRLVKPTAEENAALAEANDLDDTERRRILAIARLVEARADAYSLLGVPANTEVRDLKRAYFQLSKEIHPDRYYGRRLGTFGDRMALAFEACARAYARLTGNDRARTSSPAAQDDDQPQTQQDYAAELFERACNVEIGGDALDAMKLFAAAIRVDPQMRYLRRAANCALIAGQPRTALEYAKKAQIQAPTDPSAARLLATAFRAAGKLSDAEDVLVMAMALKTENDALAAELRHDLAEVRRLLGT